MTKFRTFEHLHNIADVNCGNDVLQALQGTGFDHILRIQSKLNHCHGLVESFARCYDVNTSCFRISNDVELYITLLDVLCITGLPIVGKPVIGSQVDGERECISCFGVVPALYEHKKGLKLNVLKDLAENGDSFEHRVRAAALLVIGSIIAPDTSNRCVNAFYCPLVQNINEIRDFAWGEATLVNLYYGLRMFKERKRNGVTGSTSLLSLFALQYIRPLLDFIGISTRPPLNFPLIVDWCREMNRASKNDAIIWQPWQLHQNLPQGVRQQMNVALAIKPMLWINICIYHQPHMTPRQLGLSNETLEAMREWFRTNVTDTFIEKPGLSGKGGKNYTELWGPQIEAINRINEQNWLVGEEDDLAAEANEAGVEEDPCPMGDVDEADLFYVCNDEMDPHPSE
ncbi:hypothetical protein NE237_024669 [Protea cynaroides]|uniref:Aminotransferase-like plant mobile domain-containing protein n=1 Tax=Protea cynaroides TaxID=273540 RepID=A0A9Q0K105_9MAGN|nr:hypothetical protein NE237_024669 [Protea cynaroides]